MGKFKIGFTAGVWDFVHVGHLAHFEKCKKYCDYLIVGVLEDPSRDRPDKNKPIMSLYERMCMLRKNIDIDFVFPYSSEQELIKLERWFPVDVRFRGIDHKGETHYYTLGKFVDIDSGLNIHSSDIRKRCQQSS